MFICLSKVYRVNFLSFKIIYQILEHHTLKQIREAKNGGIRREVKNGCTGRSLRFCYFPRVSRKVVIENKVKSIIL